MKNYNVTVNLVNGKTHLIEVNANNEEEAKKRVMSEAVTISYQPFKHEIIFIESDEVISIKAELVSKRTARAFV